MTYSDWREELSEGTKRRLVIKGLNAIKSVIKKGGEKITRDVGSIGGTKAAGRLNVDPELIKQFPGVNIRKLAYPDYKANRNPKLAKAIRIAKEKLEREKKSQGMGGSPGQLYKGVDLNKQVKKSKKDTYINPADGKEYDIPEEAIANSVGGGQIAGTVEAGDDPPVKKKKKTYAYGGRGSRKMWMANKYTGSKNT